MNIRFFGIATLFALALTACPGSTPPTVSSVTVTAPSTNALKINEAVQFGAVAKDEGNTVMTGKTFTWLSSDLNVATVDVDGKVTAKRFGAVKISASVEGKSGESASQTTYGLEAVGGTFANSGAITPGTATLTRFRKPGTPLTGTIPATLKGPTGWNGDKPIVQNFYLSDGFVQDNWWASIAAKNGSYNFEMTINGEVFSSSFEIDASQTLPSLANLTLSKVSSTSVTANWSTITGANRYLFYVYDYANSKLAFDAPTNFIYTTNTTATVSGTTPIDSTKPTTTYAAWVEAYTISPIGGTTSPTFTNVLPKQFNVTIKGVYLGTFTASMTTPLQP